MKNQKQNILILDGGQKKTLAIVRSIGRLNTYFIDVGAANKRAICFHSRYTGHRILFPDPRKEPVKYQEAILKVIKVKKYLTIIPSDYISFQLCSEIKDRILEYTHIRIVAADLIRNAGNKEWLHGIAKSKDIPTPDTRFIRKEEDVEFMMDEYNYVLKSALESGDSPIYYPTNSKEAKKIALNYLKENPGAVLIAQEKVIGDGYGFFAFYKEGKCINYFIHHRLREYPPSGGYSVAAEGHRDEKIEKNGKKILDYLKWDGVAMVEFKYDPHMDEFLLLEINAKFWGSLDLSISNGVNFPKMWLQDAKNETIDVIDKYETRKFQWILNGELFHFIERPTSIGRILKDMFYADNDIWLVDLKPNIFQLANIPVHYFKKWFR